MAREGVSLDGDALAVSNPVDDVEISGEGLEILRLRGSRDREFALGLGFSLALHAGVLILAVLAMLLGEPRGVPEASYVTVSLVQGGGCGGGPEEGRDEPAGNPAGESLALAAAPPSVTGAGCSPVTPAPEPEAGLPESPAENESAPRPENVLPSPIDPAPEVPSRPVPDPPTVRPARKPLRSGERRIPRKRQPVRERSPRASEPGAPAGSPDALPSSSGLAPVGDVAGRGDGPHHPSGVGGAGHGSRDGPAGGVSAGGGGAMPSALELAQVDTPPAVRWKVAPEFPLVARRLSVTGRVVVRFVVKTDGTVGKAFVVEADPRGFFEESALDAIRRWRFTPGRYRGDAVATWVVVPIRFRLTR